MFHFTDKLVYLVSHREESYKLFSIKKFSCEDFAYVYVCENICRINFQKELLGQRITCILNVDGNCQLSTEVILMKACRNIMCSILISLYVIMSETHRLPRSRDATLLIPFHFF